MFRNLTQMRSELLSRLKTNNQGVTNARLTAWLNDAQDLVAMMMDPMHLVDKGSFSTVADQRKYYIEQEFLKILSLVDSTGDLELEYKSEGFLEQVDPKLDDSGSPIFYSVFGNSWVKGNVDESGSSTVTVDIVSSSASDTSEKVRVNGVISGAPGTELITLNGTSTQSGLSSFSEIYSVSKDSVTSGIVTITLVGSSNVTAAVLGPNQLAREYQPIYLWPTPSDVRTINFRSIRRPRKMVNDEDFPDYPELYHEAILIAATARGHDDLFRPELSAQVRANELAPIVARLNSQQGNVPAKRSPVIRGIGAVYLKPGGRLPPEYGY